MGRNIGSVVNSINELVAELGLEKLSVAGDPGTSHPAKQEAGKANIQAASEGSRSAENTKDVKEQVTGQSITEAKPGDAKKDEAESSAKNLTTATFTGEDPKVEKGYVTNVTDPGTTSAASATGKTAADLGKCAAIVLAEMSKLAAANIADAADAREKMASILAVKPEEKEAAVSAAASEYITGYVKSAALVGELTADMLDGMAYALAKKAEGEEEEGGKKEEKEDKGGDEGAAAEMPSGGEAGGAPAAGGQGGGIDEEAAALAQAAAEIAAELGVSPEDVLDAAAAELEGGAGGAGGAPAGGAPAGAPAGMPAAPAGMEAQAAEVAMLKEKAAKYDEFMKAEAEKQAAARQAEVVQGAVSSALEKYMAAHRSETK